MKVRHLISTILRETEGGTGRADRRRGILPAVFLITECRESERVIVTRAKRAKQPDREDNSEPKKQRMGLK